MINKKTDKTNLKNIFSYVITVLKWLLISVVTGIVVGAVGTGFHYAIDYATELRNHHTWLIYLLPVGGLLIALLYHICKKDDDKGTNFILSAVKGKNIVSVITAPLIFISSTITHLFGGSAGREGAALQLGGSIANKIGRLIKLDEGEMRIITMCGMSAAFSAVFGTPVTAAIFAIEVVSVGIMHFSAIVPCAISSLVANAIAKFCSVQPTEFQLNNVPEFSFFSLGMTSLLAILCAIMSIVFCVTMHKTTELYKKLFKNRYLRIVVGGVIVIILTFIVGSYDYNGAGMHIIKNAFSGEVKYEAFILKLIFTALTIGAGYKGGEIVPVFFTGATFGNVTGRLLGLSSSFGAGIGLISLFCGVTNCPITSIILSVELFGSEGMIFFLLSCALSYMVSGYFGLYEEQEIRYSKLKLKKIDRKIQ